jgi:uncharacterized protein (DUF433 family)
MSTVIESIAVPLREGEDGALRVGKTRVLLELVIEEFEKGATPESIVENYSVLNLADVYAVLTYYLTHRDMVQAYLERRAVAASEIREMIEANQPKRDDLRQRIISQRGSRRK